MRHALTIAKKDKHLANRLVSALVFAWDDVPLATRGRLLHDAALMDDGKRDTAGGPELLRFIENLSKIARRARQSTLTFNSTGSDVAGVASSFVHQHPCRVP